MVEEPQRESLKYNGNVARNVLLILFLFQAKLKSIEVSNDDSDNSNNNNVKIIYKEKF